MAGRYDIAAIPTRYNGVLFRSRLEARYAAFFDLAGWAWEYEPFDLPGWVPDFLVTFPCGHSECGGSHSLLAEVKPYRDIKEFDGHPCLDYAYGSKTDSDGNILTHIQANASAAFGYHPRVSQFEMCHGAGGGQFDIEWALDSSQDIDDVWVRAGEAVQYRPPGAR